MRLTWGKKENWWAQFGPSHSERTAVAHSLYNMLYVVVYVGLYELSEQIYLGAKHLDKYGTSFIYISYGPPQYTIYILHIVWSLCNYWNRNASCRTSQFRGGWGKGDRRKRNSEQSQIWDLCSNAEFQPHKLSLMVVIPCILSPLCAGHGWAPACDWYDVTVVGSVRD